MTSDWLVALVGVSALAQLVAAVLALRLIPLSGRRLAWLLLAAAFLLMAFRRGITLYRILAGDVSRPADPAAESVALTIALLVLLGVIRIRDVLESQQRAERDLRVERAFLSQLFAHAPEAIIVADNDGRLLRANSEFTRLFGYTIDEAIGRSIDELIAPDDRREEAEGFTKQVTAGNSVVSETVRQRKDGKPIDISVIGTPITVEGGQVAVYGIYRDITERKRAEDALRANEARLRVLVEQMPAILWTTDEHLRFTSSVGAGLKGLGLEPGEVIGQSVYQFFRTYDSEFMPIAIHRGALEGRPGTAEVEWGGNVYQSHVQPLHDEHGAVVGCVGVALDITKRRALEAQLRQAQKMEAVGQLTGGIAHDFNNLLTVILANAQLVAKSLPKDFEEARTDLAEVLEAGRRGRTLVKKLLGFGRRSALELQDLDLGDLLEELSHVLSRVLPENLEIRVSAKRGLGVVRADPGAVEQILLNLVTNARDAMPSGGVLEIDLEPRQLEAGFVAARPGSRVGEYVCLRVRDTGEGMDPRTLEHVFEPFFTTKPADAGTGLGMAMIYGLVKQHRGFVDVTSTLGAGTTVEVYLPVSTQRAVERPDRRTPPGARGGAETILVVDDEESVRRATRRSLERSGYTVAEAADGVKALELIRRNRETIDLVITDLVMPRMGGLELRRVLLDQQWHGKILLTSGYVGGRAEVDPLLVPGVPFLHKPWTPAELLQCVRELLDEDLSGEVVSP
jgi:PAS domain S-box-containing protein